MSFCPTLEQIVGHATVLGNLKRAMALHHPGHAHLFFGPPGIGKATVAKAFVQALFCPHQAAHNGSGCGQCPPCRKVATDSHGDLVELTVAEGKTRISVDQIRQLSGFFALTPMEAPWKVAIVNDAAAMNEAAANALLKTLEEPPARSLVLLLTSQAGTLLPTIRSRCLKTRFSRLSEEEIIHILRQHPDAKTLAALPTADLQEAIRIGGQQVGRILTFSQGEWPKLRQQFQQEMERLPATSLAEIIRWAEHWAAAEKFPLFPVLLRAWLQTQLHNDAHRQQEIPGDFLEKKVQFANTTDSLLRRAAAINLNRRLLLETIYIRLARLHGAAF
ncbi:DNA polymerase III subunit delta' [Candidatus Magnetaquicoccus inordinatus]|uniref:DNA polymerase III subunit delta' n=1 Tax=Candidatus Magnetaquicoccus inordinatus TaxID=2496818 RepID=UPI00102C83A8|nr:DNA polymerase III subunit delta' [Candidatus Magnetaquicoccus inordinatus]